ncbi:MAG TPA: hypothetical protein VI455_14235 [Terriglobia bacterium]
MRAQELLWALLRMGLVAVGLYYVVAVLTTYFRSRTQRPSSFNRKDLLRSAEHLLISGGVITVAVVVSLVRPLANMLSEASAEVGEWAISRHQTQAALHTRER